MAGHINDDSGGAVDAQAQLQTHLGPIEWLARLFVIVQVVVIAVYAFANGINPTDKGWQVLYIFGVLTGLVSAAIVCGGLLGFIFGIPKLLQHQQEPARKEDDKSAESSSSPKSRIALIQKALKSNTSLEEISDWLTKTVIGVSLVQARDLFQLLKTLALRFKQLAMPDVPGAEVMFMILVASGLVIGFLFFYLQTRTRVAWMLAVVEDGPAFNNKEVKQSAALPIRVEFMQDAGGPAAGAAGKSDDKSVGRSVQPSASDTAFLKTHYSDVASPEELTAWGSAQARAGNWDEARAAIRAAIAKKPGDLDLLLRLIDIELSLIDTEVNEDKVRNALSVIAAAKSLDPNNLQVLKRELLASLYLDPPESFERAVALVKQLLSRDEMKSDPWVHLWHAAAQGQRYKWLSEHAGKERDLKNARNNALAAVKTVIELSDGPRSVEQKFLRQIFDPAGAGSPRKENDLEVFKNDADFKKAIYGE